MKEGLVNDLDRAGQWCILTLLAAITVSYYYRFIPIAYMSVYIWSSLLMFCFNGFFWCSRLPTMASLLDITHSLISPLEVAASVMDTRLVACRLVDLWRRVVPVERVDSRASVDTIRPAPTVRDVSRSITTGHGLELPRRNLMSVSVRYFTSKCRSNRLSHSELCAIIKYYLYCCQWLYGPCVHHRFNRYSLPY